MKFTEQDLEHQQQQIKALEDELSRLNTSFDSTLKTMGIAPEDLAVDPKKLTPAEKKLLDASMEEAKRAGAARASQFQSETATTGKIPGAGRRGAIRL